MTEVGVVVAAEHADVLAHFGNHSKTIYIENDEEGKPSREWKGVKTVDAIETE